MNSYTSQLPLLETERSSLPLYQYLAEHPFFLDIALKLYMMKTRKLIRTNATTSGVLSNDHAIPSTDFGVADKSPTLSGTANKPDAAFREANDVTIGSSGNITDGLTTD